MEHCKLYKLSGGDKYYIGSTSLKYLSQRKALHHQKAQINPNRPVYKYFNEIGWDKVTIELIEEVQCNTEEELRQKENELLVQHIGTPNCLNIRKAFQTPEERKKYLKDWYAKKAQEHIECSCGEMVNVFAMKYHITSKKHAKKLQTM